MKSVKETSVPLHDVIVNHSTRDEIQQKDKRMQRLAQQDKSEQSSSNRVNDRLSMRRTIYKTEIVDDKNKVSVKSVKKSEEEELIERREHLKKKALEQQKQEQQENEDALLEMLGESEKEEDDEDFAEEDDQEEVLMRPVFVDKENRATIQEQMQKEIDEMANKEETEKMKERRKQETKKIVIEYIKKDLNGEVEETNGMHFDMPDDTDDINNLEEYEQWKLRELKRIKKQVEEDEEKMKDKIEIERRRNLTDEQRQDENLRLGSDATLIHFKSKYKFLQKYYHRGAFYQSEAKVDTEHIYNRDYNLPTAEDKFDRSSLPSVLQKRRGLIFKKGQSKYTHLTNEDTTEFDPMYKVPENIAKKITKSMGGYKHK